jgi:mono/diheme cytochrome c family protein
MPAKTWTKHIAVMALLLLLASCGGGDTDNKAQTPAERAAALDNGPRAAATIKFDGSLAETGELLFDDKSCSDCHTMGEADMAPDLIGVLDRRTEAWLTMQIIKPEWMSQNDTITKGLIDEYDMVMVVEEISEAEAEAILQYLLREGRNNKETSN